MVRQLSFFSLLSVLVVASAALVPQAAIARETPVQEDDEYNFSWLDPDKKVYVLQNRKYRKAKRLSAFLSGGLNLSNPYRSESLIIPRLSYSFSEQFGIEVFYAKINSSPNSTFDALDDAASSSGALPFVRRHHSYFGGLFTWAPWYAKLNFFNKILYLDWFFNVGAGQASTSVDRNRNKTAPPNFVDENVFAWFFGTGQNFYVTQHFLVRLDVLGSFYSATGKSATSSRTFTNFDFTVGVGYLF